MNIGSDPIIKLLYVFTASVEQSVILYMLSCSVYSSLLMGYSRKNPHPRQMAFRKISQEGGGGGSRALEIQTGGGGGETLNPLLWRFILSD